MTDRQLQVRLKIKHILFVAVIFLLASIGLLYFKLSTDEEVARYRSEKSQEQTLQSQIDTLTNENNELQAVIEETGKTLVSFSEDKIKYINLASDLSSRFGVRIGKLAVSDVWTEGQMYGMTTDIEVEGDLSDVKSFVAEYCGEATNRINKISCRPIDRYPWLARSIDGEQVLRWFDLSAEESAYETEMASQVAAIPDTANQYEAGVRVVPEGTELNMDDEDNIITIKDMFSSKTMRVYLNIDFLGRN